MWMKEDKIPNFFPAEGENKIVFLMTEISPEEGSRKEYY